MLYYFEVDYLYLSLFQGKISEIQQRNLLFHLFSESEGDVGEVREHEEDPDWIEGEVSEVSEIESEGEMESEDTDVGVSVDPVPSTSHATGKFYKPARSRCPLRAKREPARRGTHGVRGARVCALVSRGSTSDRGGSRATNVHPQPQRTFPQRILINHIMMRMREIPVISFHPLPLHLHVLLGYNSNSLCSGVG